MLDYRPEVVVGVVIDGVLGLVGIRDGKVEGRDGHGDVLVGLDGDGDDDTESRTTSSTESLGSVNAVHRMRRREQNLPRKGQSWCRGRQSRSGHWQGRPRKQGPDQQPCP